MRHAGLFSGIGGFSLAAQWMGWENVFEVEIDNWCRRVLHKNFPLSQLYKDVCTFSGLPFRGTIDVLSGGFPCQPWSSAGKGLGTADARHLWPQFLRIIREVQPRYVVAKTFAACLVGAKGYNSSKCVLTWKLRATKSNRYYFQLRALGPTTSATGSGLLPTPSAGCFNDSETPESWLARAAKMKAKHNNGNGAGMPLAVGRES